MKLLIKKIYIILFLLTLSLVECKVLAKDNKAQYSREDISNYFLGIISVNQDRNKIAFDYLKKVKSLKNKHSKFNVEFLRTLILLEKFDEALDFSKSVWNEEELFFEADLLLGLDYFIKRDYLNAEKYFIRLNKISRYNLIFENFIGNVLISWSRAAQENKESSFEFLERIPRPYRHLTKIQNSFLECYFDTSRTQRSFKELIQDEDYDFSRYNFFLTNHLLFKDKIIEAKKIIDNSIEKNNSNLLIKQTENFVLNNEYNKIKNFFNCNNPNDVIAEFFYVLANLYSSEKDYQMSNFYLKISLLLNSNFIPNKILLAENYFYQKKFENSKKVYKSIKRIGPVYSWFASRSIAIILAASGNKKDSISYLEKQFSKLSNLNFEHYYELANFYKDNEYYEESIKYYSLALENIKQGHRLIPKILDRRGTSYERNGNWEKAENDLLKSLKLLPDQPYVLNYLAYSWIEKKINIDEALEMLKEAARLKENDGYIIDSLGWAYYARKNYIEAEKFLQKAVELKPLDPIINDHYADSLWMLKKNIQATYVWRRVLTLDNTEQETKEKIKKKLIFGITNNL